MGSASRWLTYTPERRPTPGPLRTDMRLRLLLSLLCAIFALPGLARGASDPPTGEQPAAIAFVHVNVIPMDRERVLEDQTVVIEGGRIKQIGSSKTIKLQA